MGVLFLHWRGQYGWCRLLDFKRDDCLKLCHRGWGRCFQQHCIEGLPKHCAMPQILMLSFDWRYHICSPIEGVRWSLIRDAEDWLLGTLEPFQDLVCYLIHSKTVSIFAERWLFRQSGRGITREDIISSEVLKWFLPLFEMRCPYVSRLRSFLLLLVLLLTYEWSRSILFFDSILFKKHKIRVLRHLLKIRTPKNNAWADGKTSLGERGYRVVPWLTSGPGRACRSHFIKIIKFSIHYSF